MSAYVINKVLYLTENDADFRRRIQADPEGVVAELPLAPEELAAFRAGDVYALYRMGAHPFLLNNLPRHGLFGVTDENYKRRIRQEERP